jgi:hypothetical protein
MILFCVRDCNENPFAEMRSIPYCVGRNLALLVLQERSPVGRAKANVLNLGIAKTALPNAQDNNY